MDNEALANLFDDNPILPELNNEQKLLILKTWEENPDNPPSIEELLLKVYPNSKNKLDGRTKEGRLVKAFLIEKKLKVLTKTEYKPKSSIELTKEQKEYIRNNTNMTALEQAEVIFNNNNLFQLSRETRAVSKYREELKQDGVIFENDNEEQDFEEYKPPKRIEHVCARINKNIQGANFDSHKLTPTQKKQAYALISHLHSIRFIHQMGLINNADDRKLFENTFLKYVYDKPDLTQEDLDQYTILANESVMSSSIQRTIFSLQQEQSRNLESDGRISQALVELIKTSRDEYNACVTRQSRLYKSLTEERSKRLSERIGPQFTLLNIIEEFKNEEKRKEVIKEGEKRNEKLKAEISRLSKLDEIVTRIYGIDEDLVING